MELFFLQSNNFLQEVELKNLPCFETEKVFATEKRQREFTLGRFLLNFVLEKYYGIGDVKIVVEDKKPKLKNAQIHFSLSHSNDIVAVVFDKKEIGFDLEFMKERDFEKLFSYYKLELEKRNKKSFYEFWTAYEARIKLQKEPASSFCGSFLNEYIFCVCSGENREIEKQLKVHEVTFEKSTKNFKITEQSTY